MTPVVFEGCFGWLHDAPGETGVVLCNAYGHEDLWAHPSWRGLAEHFAENHIPALRFDYRGTGDSVGDEDEPGRVDVWLNSIADAVRFMRETTGVQRVVLCGIRLGGMLAALAAEQIGNIDGLILMAPVASGREYLRELRLIHRRWRNTSAPHIDAGPQSVPYVETLGFRLNPEAVERLGNLTLLHPAPATSMRVLILDPVKVAAADKLRDRYVAAGACVDVMEFPDYAHLMSELTASKRPRDTYAVLSSWIAGDAVLGAHRAPRTAVDVTSGNEGAPRRDVATETVLSAVLEGDGYVETPVIFDNGRLFGVYCRPSTRKVSDASSVAEAPLHDGEPMLTVLSGIGSDAEQYAVLFTNTAGSHHVGEARMWVTNARRLARQGVASLRMDVGLLGDSAGAAASMSVAALHASQSSADVSTAIDWLVDAGHTRPTAVGICSGAYLTFHAAAMNPRLSGALLVNQREFWWEEGRVELSVEPTVASTRVYLRSLKSGAKWKRLLHGDIPVSAIVGGLIRRRSRRWKEFAKHLTNSLSGRQSMRGLVRQKFQAIHDRGVSLRVLYGEFDEGLDECPTFFGNNFAWLRRLSSVRVRTDASVDHALFLYPARDLLMTLIERQLVDQAKAVSAGRTAPAVFTPSRRRFSLGQVLAAAQRTVAAEH